MKHIRRREVTLKLELAIQFERKKIVIKSEQVRFKKGEKVEKKKKNYLSQAHIFGMSGGELPNRDAI